MKSDVLISSAKSYLGMPYVWGGESWGEGGCDCSGLFYLTLRKAGYPCVRTTAQGFSKYGIPVKEKAKGDLLFFGSSVNKITHCAIYLGNNQMIESRGSAKNTKSNPGTGVVISNVNRRSDLVKITRICSDSVDYYKVGKIYTVRVDNLNVRAGAGTNFPKKAKSQLTADGQKHANAKGHLMSGTVVTCKTIKTVGNQTWLQIPSGWICARDNGKIYVS